MNDLEKINDRVKKEVELKNYKGEDRMVLAQDKWLEIQEELKTRPEFRLNMGIPKLDSVLGKLGLGRLVVLSGPPKNGKTQMCQTFTKRFVEQGKKVAWFSYEVGYEELFGKFPMQNLDFHVPNQLESRGIDWIEDKIIEAKQKYGTQVIFIDNLDFLRDPKALRNIGMNMSSYIGGIVQQLKLLSVQQNVIIFLMSHLTKNNWSTNKLPSSEDLRDSGQVAQLADVVMMIIRTRDKTVGSQTIYKGTEATVGVIENRLSGETVIAQVEFRNGEFFELINTQEYQPQYESQTNNPDTEEAWQSRISDVL